MELNPVTYSLVTEKLADFDGHIAENPKVNYVKGDGRTFLARSGDKYNLLWYPAPDSYSATNAATSGAFVLSESYLYTSEIIKDSLEHLAPNGMIATQYGEFDYEKRSNRTTRYVATARHALGELGIHDPSRHILVVTSPTEPPSSLSTILVKKEPFTQAEVDRTLASLQAVPGAKLRYAPGHSVPGESVSELATLPGSKLGGFYDSYPYNVRPVTDDGPFFWHFTPFGDVISNFTHSLNDRDLEVAVGERALLLLLFISVALAVVFLLLPFVTIRRTWAALPRKPRSALYFATLGLGFIFFEITLIQRLTLFLGYPTYSLTVTLASLLLFTGVGALLDVAVPSAEPRARPPARRDRRADALLPIRAPSLDRRSSRLAVRRTRHAHVRGPGPARALPRHVHAPRVGSDLAVDDVLAGVRRMGLGSERVRVRRRRGALDHPRDGVRLPRRAVPRTRSVPRRPGDATKPPPPELGRQRRARAADGSTGARHRWSTRGRLAVDHVPGDARRRARGCPRYNVPL